MEFIEALSSNKAFFSVAMLVTNIGSRFVIMDINKTHEKLLMHEVIRKIVIFCMFFVGTRDIMTSIILTFAFIVFIDGLLNEKSRFNIVPGFLRKGKDSEVKGKGDSSDSDRDSNGIKSESGISFEQFKQALFVVEKYKNQQQKSS